MKKKNVLKKGTIYTGKNKLINNIFFKSLQKRRCLERMYGKPCKGR